ncbi:diacylglycerol/lipid kinase family protein [Sansalvadorimonas verongulae]|uniref:diacylglycerol/lipid kinase family protein n=1 Tax=Sansalvadorimonas verongulae TaxID=2172824 RepID=UPI0018AD1453|nr:diacylglycerol kinase family protein [Sansalvadorimonas verongulae]
MSLNREAATTLIYDQDDRFALETDTHLRGIRKKYIYGVRRTPRNDTLLITHGDPFREDDSQKYPILQVELRFNNAREKETAFKKLNEALFGRSDGLASRRPLKVIVNPVSGERRGNEVWAKVAQLLADAQIQTEVYFTEAAGDAETEAKRLIGKEEEYSGVMVVGGDGTVYEVLNGLTSRGDMFNDLPVMMIPAGTGNGMVASLGIRHYNRAALGVIQAIRNERSASLPEWPLLNYTLLQAPNGDEEDEPKALEHGVSFMGLHTAIATDVDIGSELIRGVPGRETLWAIKELVRPKHHPVKFSGKRKGGDDQYFESEGDFTYLMVMNIPWASADHHIAPDLDPRTEGMHVIHINRRDAPLRERFHAFTHMSDGSYINRPAVRRNKDVHKISVTDEAQRVGQNLFTIDGELKVGGQIDLEISRHKLKILYL